MLARARLSRPGDLPGACRGFECGRRRRRLGRFDPRRPDPRQLAGDPLEAARLRANDDTGSERRANDARVRVAAPEVRAAENEHGLVARWTLAVGALSALAREIEQKRPFLRVDRRVSEDFGTDRLQSRGFDQPARDLIAPHDAEQQRQRHGPGGGDGGEPFRRRHAPPLRHGGGAASN